MMKRSYLLLIALLSQMVSAADPFPKTFEEFKERYQHQKQKAGNFIQIDDMILPRRAMKAGAFAAIVWPGELFYTFDDDVTRGSRDVWLAAAAQWTDAIGIQFIERTDQPNYVFIMNADFNASMVGMIGGEQPMWMSDWNSTVAGHEIGHALGLLHEQSRQDRDSYVTIDFDHVNPDNAHNFDIVETEDLTAYDFRSIMHYSQRAFSTSGRATIVPHQRYNSYRIFMGSGAALSLGDQGGVAALYGTKTDDHGNSTALATAWDLTGAVTGELDYDVDLDVFAIDVDSPGILTITASADPAFTVRVFNSFNGMISESEGPTQPFDLDTELLHGGRYYVKVFSNEFSKGSYQLSANFTATALPTDVVIPDEALRTQLLAEFDGDRDGSLSFDEAAAATQMGVFDTAVKGLIGLEAFVNLEYLSIVGTSVSDLTPLSNLQKLKGLTIFEAPVTELSPLSGLTGLEDLSLRGCQISNVEPLTSLQNVASLALANNPLTDISALASMPKLQALDLSFTPVTSLASLKQIELLQVLILAENPLADVSELGELTSLARLMMFEIIIPDSGFLVSLTNLELLGIVAADLKNLDFVTSLPKLDTLWTINNPITDLGPLASAEELELLSLAGIQATDLTPLSGLKSLNLLGIENSTITDVAPLAGLPVTQLVLADNQITDIAPLATENALPLLQYLEIQGNLLGQDQCPHIQAISNRGVEILYEGQKELVLNCSVFPEADPTRWIPHVTADNGGFQTTVTLTNTSFTGEGAVTLRAYDASGTFLVDANVSVPNGSHQTIAAATLFDGQPVSHFSIGSDPGVVVTSAFRVTLDKVGGTAHIKETSAIGRRFVLYPGERETVWDGMALVNLGSASTAVTAVAVDSNGLVLEQVNIEDNLPANGKTLLVLENVLGEHPGSRIEIHTSQPSVLMFLRGSKGEGASYLYQTEPIVLE